MATTTKTSSEHLAPRACSCPPPMARIRNASSAAITMENVWVVATAKTEKGKDGKPLVGKSYLVVTVPTYIKWDQPEVGQ